MNDVCWLGVLLQAVEAVQPYWKVIKDVVLPFWQKALTLSEPQRAKLMEMSNQYWAKVNDAVLKPTVQVTLLDSNVHSSWLQ